MKKLHSKKKKEHEKKEKHSETKKPNIKGLKVEHIIVRK